MKFARAVLASSLLLGMLPFAFAQEKVKFETKLEKDKAFYQQVTNEINQIVEIQGGAKSTLKHKHTFMFKWTPVKFENDVWTVKMKIEGAKLEVDLANNKVQYDSTAKEGSGNVNNAGLNEFFKNLINYEFTVTFGKGMVVQKVEGRDDFLKKLGTSNPQMEGVLKKILTEEALKEMMDPATGIAPPAGMDKIIPDKAVGEKWTKTSVLNLGPVGMYDRTLDFNFTKVDGDLAIVEVTSKLKYKSPAAADADGLLFRIKDGTVETPADNKGQAGIFMFNKKEGRLVKATIDVTMKGTLTVVIGSTESKVDLFQEQKTTFETKNESFINPTTPAPKAP